MLGVKGTRKTHGGAAFFESASSEMTTVKNKGLKNYVGQETKAGTSIVTNIAFQNNTVINVHPATDPREPRFVSPEREEKLEENKTSKCFWPFSLCC
jgi:hypothetical protein